MALAAIISIVAVCTIGAYVSSVIFIVAFRDFVCLLVVAGSAILVARHAFHVSAFLTFMMAGYAGFPHFLADVDLVIEVHHAPVRIKLDCLGKGGHDTTRFLKCKPLAYVTGVADYFHGHGLVAFDAVGAYKMRMRWIFAFEFPCLPIVVAGATVVFDFRCNDFFVKIVMAIIALG
jgi:hypothetical protein